EFFRRWREYRQVIREVEALFRRRACRAGHDAIRVHLDRSRGFRLPAGGIAEVGEKSRDARPIAWRGLIKRRWKDNPLRVELPRSALGAFRTLAKAIKSTGVSC